MKAKLIFTIILMPFIISGQVINDASLDTLLLNDSLSVVVGTPVDCNHCYYYWPTNLRLSSNKNGVPEISFTTWNNGENTEIIGGILHFLVVWGLTFEQEENLQKELTESIDSLGVLLGAITIESTEETISIKGEDKIAELLRKRNTRKTPIATTPGAKMAMSFSFGKEGIKEILKAFKNCEEGQANLSLGFYFDTKSKQNGTLIKCNYNLSLPIQTILVHIKKEW